jgi:hypothetical protein
MQKMLIWFVWRPVTKILYIHITRLTIWKRSSSDIINVVHYVAIFNQRIQEFLAKLTSAHPDKFNKFLSSEDFVWLLMHLENYSARAAVLEALCENLPPK